MIIGKVVGTVVATRKDPNLEGFKLLIVKHLNLKGEFTGGFVVAVDAVGAGFNEKVLVVSGSSARQTLKTKNKPVDAVIAGIIDSIEINEEWNKIP